MSRRATFSLWRTLRGRSFVAGSSTTPSYGSAAGRSPPPCLPWPWWPSGEGCGGGLSDPPARRRSGDLAAQHAAADLVFLDRFEERLEVALAESVVALALDELEEDRPD